MMECRTLDEYVMDGLEGIAAEVTKWGSVAEAQEASVRCW